MQEQTLIFIAASFLLLSTSRLCLSLWQWQRVRLNGGLAPIMLGGLRIDAHQIAVLVGIPALLAPWLGHSPLFVDITGFWLQLSWLLLVLLEVSTPQFVHEYDTRPDRLYVQYLQHPKEVFGMLWKGYKPVIFGGVGALALFGWGGHVLFGQVTPDAPVVWWQAIVLSLVTAVIVFLAIRGTLKHRPINPSSVAYCGDSMLNTLPLNSLYSVIYAIYSKKNERSAADVYGNMSADEVSAVVRECAGIENTNPSIPTLHHQTAAHTHTQPLNIVIIVEESLGAQFTGYLKGQGLTPQLDALSKQAWNLTRTYATGTRSVRGLEALSAGFPPTVSDAALRLPGAQSRFFTLAQALRLQGYSSTFIYGGEAHFDNMKSFFLGNGFDRIIEREHFQNPAFVGTWGASDEDMFNELHHHLSTPSESPTFTLAFSVSNHSPWEYPKGRIVPDGDPATVDNTIRYADWAIGQFFEMARQSAYWDNTVFLIAADHDARVGGMSLIPLKHFHIPALFLGGTIAPKQDDRLVSQIDLAPTLLSLAGVNLEHPMIGQDLNQPRTGGRAMMQFSENYGYLKDNQLVVLEPHRPASQFTYSSGDTYAPQPLDEALHREALAHAIWPNQVYKQGQYTLPHLMVKQ